MATGDDLAASALAAVLGDRRFQSHAVLLSTAVAANQWAGEGAPHGAVVVADYQIAPRGRAGRSWKVTPGQGLGFALVLRPQLPAEREGWLYTVVLAALADVCGEGVTVEWPDEIHRGDTMLAGVGMEVRLGGRGVKWAVANVLIQKAEPPRAELLAAVLQAIDERLAAATSAVLDDCAARCRTVGRSVRVRLLGGTGRLQGEAVELAGDGSLVVDTDDGRRIAVRPQDIGSIEQL